MRRIDYIRAMTVKEMAKAIVENNLTDEYCRDGKSGCELARTPCVQCCMKWLEEDDPEFKN